MRAHVLPTGNDADDSRVDSVTAFRDFRQVRGRMRAAYDASSAYLDGLDSPPGSADARTGED